MPVAFSMRLRASADLFMALTVTAGERRGDLALEVGAGQQLGRAADLAFLLLDRERPQHEAREVDLPLLPLVRRVGTDDVAELALVALVDDLVDARHRRAR